MFISPEVQMRYLNRRVGDLAAAKEAIDRNDFQFFAKLGHDWKGNGETYGFPEFSQWGRGIESAAHDKELNLIQEILSEVRIFLQKKGY